MFGHGTDNAGDEAFWLLRHLQEWRDVDWSAPPAPAVLGAALEIAARRVAERKPLAYLLGEAWFADLRFTVDERVLVPRSPLAETIERGFAPWCALRPGDRVLDIGTGSGCLAIAAAHYSPEALVDATDVSADALAVAALNVARHGVGARVRLYEADLFPPTRTRYRVIMSNPPYVSDAEMAEAAARVSGGACARARGRAEGIRAGGARAARGARAAHAGRLPVRRGRRAARRRSRPPIRGCRWSGSSSSAAATACSCSSAAEIEEFLRAG